MSISIPKVSVVMSVYNGSRYLRESIESILSQSFTDFEFIIIDDGSTDNTWEILTQYSDRDRRIRLFQNEKNLGLTKSLNKGLRLARGEYIARQDADDVSLTQRFEKQVALLNNHPESVLASCNVEVINPEGKTVAKHEQACDSKFVAWYLLFYNHIAGHSQVMFRREPVIDLGGYCEARRYSQDYELWSRLIKVGDIVILPEALQQQRLHNNSVSAQKGSQQQTLSLSQSKQNLERLIAEELNLEQVEDLRWFWVGHNDWWAHFPNARKASNIHSRLKQIYLAFLKRREQQNFSELAMSTQLRLLIGQQFVRWIESVSILNLPTRLKISVYAFWWHPIGVINCWLKDIWRVPSRKLLTLVQKPPAKTVSLSILRQESSSIDLHGN